MKNLLLFSLLFFLGSTLAIGGNYELGGIAEADIINSKTGTVIYSFSIPQKYIEKDGSLTKPIVITLLNESSKTAIITIVTKDLSTSLPCGFSGKYVLVIRIGEFILSGEIDLR